MVKVFHFFREILNTRPFAYRPFAVVVKGVAISAVGLGFDFLDGLVWHIIATAATFLQSYVARALSRGNGPA